MQALTGVWRESGGEPEALAHLDVDDTGPLLPSIFKVSTAATAMVGAATLAAARLWHERGGSAKPARVRVGVREAAIAFRSERYLRVPEEDLALGDPLTADYRTADGWVRLHCNYPHHRDAALRALGVSTAEGVADAVRGWAALDLEEAVVAAGGAAAALRTGAEWCVHPQGAAVAALPLVGRRRLGEPAATPLAQALAQAPARPLCGVRVLDLTRVIAGPVAGRTLAAHGADVLRVGADHLALVPVLVVDTGFGKRFTHLDLRTRAGTAALRDLAAEADVVLQAYRPGSLRQRGLGPDELAQRRPGLIYVDIGTWGQAGPWRGRRGFDSLVQLACGIAHEGRVASGDPDGPPRALPAQLLDHATGYLAALAAMQALRHRHATGQGSHVQVSLARTAQWVDSLGRVPGGLAVPDPGPDEVGDLLASMVTPFGPVSYVRPPGSIDGAPPQWVTPPHRPGTDPPTWS